MGGREKKKNQSKSLKSKLHSKQQRKHEVVVGLYRDLPEFSSSLSPETQKEYLRNKLAAQELFAEMAPV